MPPGLWMDGRVSAAAVKFLTRIPRVDLETDNQLLFGHQTFAGLPPCQAKPLGSSLSVGIEATTTNQMKPGGTVLLHIIVCLDPISGSLLGTLLPATSNTRLVCPLSIIHHIPIHNTYLSFLLLLLLPSFTLLFLSSLMLVSLFSLVVLGDFSFFPPNPDTFHLNMTSCLLTPWSSHSYRSLPVCFQTTKKCHFDCQTPTTRRVVGGSLTKRVVRTSSSSRTHRHNLLGRWSTGD